MKISLFLLALALSCYSLSATAVSDVKEVAVNCDNVKLNINTRYSTDFRATAFWVDANAFPNPPKENTTGYLYPGNVEYFKFSCPDYSVYYNRDMIEVKAKTYNDVLKAIPPTSQKINLKFMSYTFDLATLELQDPRAGLAYSRRSENTDILPMAPKTAVIGYKVDGGKLKPLLYNQVVSDYKPDLTKADKIDVYHKDDGSSLSQIKHRIYIDKPNGILRIYSNHPFPKN